jgi:hypothetical protein
MPSEMMNNQRIMPAWIITTVLVVSIGCSPPLDPDAPRKEVLQTLLSEHATRESIALKLGKAYVWDEQGSASWNANDSTRPREVVEASKRYRRVMVYTTTWQRTWIFLDDQDAMQAYFIAGQ